MKKAVLLVSAGLSFFMSCTKNVNTNNNPACDPAISFSKNVKPIFATRCAGSGCHDGNDLPLITDYTTAKDAAAQIRDAVNRGIMPKNATLPDSEKTSIICWIDNGAKNN